MKEKKKKRVKGKKENGRKKGKKLQTKKEVRNGKKKKSLLSGFGNSDSWGPFVLITAEQRFCRY